MLKMTMNYKENNIQFRKVSFKNFKDLKIEKNF